MNRKERLASIIEEAQRYYVADCTDDSESEYIAEWLLSSGVVVPRILAGEEIFTLRVRSKGIGAKNCFCDSIRFLKACLKHGDTVYIAPRTAHNYHNQHLGSTVFRTYDEAKFALEKIVEGGGRDG